MAKVCVQCGAAGQDDGVVCAFCGCELRGSEGNEFRASAPQMSGTVPAIRIEDSPAYIGNTELTGIGGWLILIAINLAVGPVLLIIGVFGDLHFLGDGLSVKKGLAVLVLAEAITNTIMILALIGLNFLFYQQRRQFPRWMITYFIAGFIIALCDHLCAMIFAPSTSWLEVFRSLIATLIWVPYLLQSQRVEQTFVK